MCIYCRFIYQALASFAAKIAASKRDVDRDQSPLTDNTPRVPNELAR